MTVMAAPLTIAFMFLSAASVLTVPRRCNGFALLDRTADTTVTVAGGDGHASNAIHRVADPSGAVSARLVRMARFLPAFHALAARVVSPRIRHFFTQRNVVVNPVLDILGALFLLLGAMLCFAASVGLLRFPDAPTRMHAATKPQTLGLLCATVGLALSLQNFQAIGLLVLIIVLQLATSPVSAHMVGRTAYRTGQIRRELLYEDDLADDLTAAGFRLSSDENDDGSLDEPPDGDCPPAAPDARPPTTEPGPEAGDSEP